MRPIQLAVAIILASPVFAADPICADRPGKATGTCTVAPGHAQVETGLADWSRRGDDSVVALGSTSFRWRVGEKTDVGLALSPFVSVTSGNDRQSGWSDLVVRAKTRLTPSDTGFQLALAPFVKLPTARGALGNGKVEGGIVGAMTKPLNGMLSVTLSPEIDLLADERGYHPVFAGAASVSASVRPRLTATAEVWAARNRDDTQASLDVAAAYLITEFAQWDAGVNVGLTRSTPATQVYAGIALRF